MKRNYLFLLLFMMNGIISALATVTDSTSNSFTSRHEASVKVNPGRVYDHFVNNVGQWWDSDHTYSGNARNLRIDPKAGGLFLEKLASGGTVRHMEVVYADPGKLLRMEGGLGPLQQFPVNGVMTLMITEKQGETQITLTYTVGGYVTGGLAKLSGLVDQVMGQQFGRFIKFCNEQAP